MERRNCKVSIIIPIYNKEETLERCFESVLNQQYKNIEVIVINDGSTDNSKRVCEEYAKRDNRFRVISQKNGGVSRARNAGISRASGDYLFFLDADDQIDENVISDLVFATKNRNTLYGCKMKTVYEYGEETLKRNASYSVDEFFKAILVEGLQSFSCGYLYNTSICKKIGFNEKVAYCEDLLFLTDYLKLGKIDKVSYIDSGASYVYYQNGNSVTLSSEKMFDNLLNMRRAFSEFDAKTEYIYSELVNNKIIELHESELQKATTLKQFREIIDKFKFDKKYTGHKIRIKRFFSLYEKKRVFGLKVYYVIRRVAQLIKRKGMRKA